MAASSWVFTSSSIFFSSVIFCQIDCWHLGTSFREDLVTQTDTLGIAYHLSLRHGEEGVCCAGFVALHNL